LKVFSSNVTKCCDWCTSRLFLNFIVKSHLLQLELATMQQQLVQLGSTAAATAAVAAAAGGGGGGRVVRDPAASAATAAGGGGGGLMGLTEALWQLGRWHQRAEELEGQLDLVSEGLRAE
jgi:hypothetical protein